MQNWEIECKFPYEKTQQIHKKIDDNLIWVVVRNSFFNKKRFKIITKSVFGIVISSPKYDLEFGYMTNTGEIIWEFDHKNCIFNNRKDAEMCVEKLNSRY